MTKGLNEEGVAPYVMRRPRMAGFPGCLHVSTGPAPVAASQRSSLVAQPEQVEADLVAGEDLVVGEHTS